MSLLIDGYNLIGRSGNFGLSLKDEDKETRVADLLSRYRFRKGIKEDVIVIFDGQSAQSGWRETRSGRGGITIEYAVGRTADEAIVSKARSADHPGSISVVTSDIDLKKRLGPLGAKVISCEDFLLRVKKVLFPARAVLDDKPELPCEEEVEKWLDIFKERDD